MPALSIPNTFAPSTTILSAAVNTNFTAVQTAVNNVDNSQIGALGIYASQIIPTNGTQASFGGSQNYTFSNGLTVNTSLAVGTSLTVGTTLGVTGAATFSSTVVGGSYQATGFSAVGTQGAFIQWSRAGNGSTYIINQKGLGTGGIIFGHSTVGNAFTQDAFLAEGGGLTLAGGITASAAILTSATYSFGSAVFNNATQIGNNGSGLRSVPSSALFVYIPSVGQQASMDTAGNFAIGGALVCNGTVYFGTYGAAPYIQASGSSVGVTGQFTCANIICQGINNQNYGITNGGPAAFSTISGTTITCGNINSSGTYTGAINATSGAINCSGTFSGNVTGTINTISTGLGSGGTGLYFNTPLGAVQFNSGVFGGSSVAFIGWNKTGGDGEADLYSGNNVSSSNAIQFGAWNGSSYTTVGSYDRSGNFSMGSDAKLKTNVKDMESVLDKVNKLQPRRFNWIKRVHDDCREDSGFVAQEIQEHFPELVKVMKDKENGDHLGLNYTKLTVFLTKAIQEQQELIQSLQHQVSMMAQVLESHVNPHA